MKAINWSSFNDLEIPASTEVSPEVVTAEAVTKLLDNDRKFRSEIQYLAGQDTDDHPFELRSPSLGGRGITAARDASTGFCRVTHTVTVDTFHSIEWNIVAKALDGAIAILVVPGESQLEFTLKTIVSDLQRITAWQIHTEHEGEAILELLFSSIKPAIALPPTITLTSATEHLLNLSILSALGPIALSDITLPEVFKVADSDQDGRFKMTKITRSVQATPPSSTAQPMAKKRRLATENFVVIADPEHSEPTDETAMPRTIPTEKSAQDTKNLQEARGTFEPTLFLRLAGAPPNLDHAARKFLSRLTLDFPHISGNWNLSLAKSWVLMSWSTDATVGIRLGLFHSTGKVSCTEDLISALSNLKVLETSMRGGHMAAIMEAYTNLLVLTDGLSVMPTSTIAKILTTRMMLMRLFSEESSTDDLFQRAANAFSVSLSQPDIARAMITRPQHFPASPQPGVRDQVAAKLKGQSSPCFTWIRHGECHRQGCRFPHKWGTNDPAERTRLEAAANAFRKPK